MRKIFGFLFILLISATLSSKGQIQTPAASTHSVLEQRVGLTDIVVDYSRPSLRGRKAFVDVNSFGEIWRTGANAATTISFSKDVSLEGKEVPAGKYALYTIPGQETWTVMIYKDLSVGGAVANYKESDELTRFTVKSVKNPLHVETFTINIGDITDHDAVIRLLWGDIMVPFKLSVKTEEQVMASIDSFEASNNNQMAGQYSAAATYYLNNKKDLSKALDWIDKAIKINPNAFWYVQTKARIQAAQGNYAGAIATAKESSDIAGKADDDFGYIQVNQNLIKDWEGK